MNHNMLQDPRVGYAVALATAATFVLTAESGPSDEVSELAHKTQPAAVQIVEAHPYEDSNTSDNELCVRPGNYDLGKEYEAAERCRDSYRNRRFALVDFTALSEYTMKEIAQDTQSGLRWATAGIVKSTVKVVEPSKAVARKLKEQRGGSCIDYNNPATYASTFAKEHMPELHKYDHIMAITDIPACPPKDGGTILGVANTAPGRFADVFDAANRYKQQGVEEVKKTAIHEGGHILGLDHNSSAGCTPEISKPYRNGQLPPIDLVAYLESCQHKEYYEQPNNIMGHATGGIATLQANPLQRHDLLWPEKVLRGETWVPGKKIGTTGLIFTAEGIQKFYQYGIIDLSKEAVVYDDKQKPHSFTQLSLVPQVMPRGKGNDVSVSNVRLYLSNEQGQHVDLGPVASASATGPKQRFISHGNQVIELSVQSNQVMMRQSTSK